jgi:protein arginine kinase activator
MKCDSCGQSEATIHQIHVVDDEIKHLQLCEDCAKDQNSESLQGETGVEEAFSNLEDAEDETEQCPSCGMTLSELRNRNKVGCENCYLTFRDQLESLVHRIHGAEQHVGDDLVNTADSEPMESSGGLGKVSENKKKQMLEKRLEKRVEEEDYERAAELRDRIEALDQEATGDVTSD